MVGSRDAVDEARVRRKRMGGGMRQVGILAAAGLHALDHHVDRLADDHAHARLLAEACGVDPATVDTNIVVVERSDAAAFVAAAAEQGVRVATVGPTAVRMVTHLDVSAEDAAARPPSCRACNSVFGSLPRCSNAQVDARTRVTVTARALTPAAPRPARPR